MPAMTRGSRPSPMRSWTTATTREGPTTSPSPWTSPPERPAVTGSGTTRWSFQDWTAAAGSRPVTGTDTITGGPGPDVIYANGGRDDVNGGAGNDSIETFGQSTVRGSSGD